VHLLHLRPVGAIVDPYVGLRAVLVGDLGKGAGRQGRRGEKGGEQHLGWQGKRRRSGERKAEGSERGSSYMSFLSEVPLWRPASTKVLVVISLRQADLQVVIDEGRVCEM